jgi:hypothetical protein
MRIQNRTLPWLWLTQTPSQPPSKSEQPMQTPGLSDGQPPSNSGELRQTPIIFPFKHVLVTVVATVLIA